MGFNTVIFMINDYSYQIQKSPNSVLWMITHPPNSNDSGEFESIRRQVVSIANQSNEPIPDQQMIEVLPTFHADWTHYYRAGGNCIDNLEVVKFTTIKGERCVVLKLPKYLEK